MASADKITLVNTSVPQDPPVTQQDPRHGYAYGYDQPAVYSGGYIQQTSSGPTTLVGSQPADTSRVAPRVRPPSYFLLSVVGILFLNPCWLFAVIASIIAAKTPCDTEEGYENARTASRVALLFNILGWSFWSFLSLFYLMFFFFPKTYY